MFQIFVKTPFDKYKRQRFRDSTCKNGLRKNYKRANKAILGAGALSRPGPPTLLFVIKCYPSWADSNSIRSGVFIPNSIIYCGNITCWVGIRRDIYVILPDVISTSQGRGD
ncbi:Uncharacterised protein [uncultured archaeon]|nr:Uncharacterised protein [uncultured archaeon]